jgi:putative flippase GtrA
MSSDSKIGGTSKYASQVFVRRFRLQRPAKFVLVGGVGVLVQIAALEALTALGCHYLLATGIAVEAAVLHNFVWHQRFTWRDWRDRQDRSDRCIRGGSSFAQTGVRLLRFHLSNGVISILGSLLLMRWLVGQFGIGVMMANLMSIAACSVGNFLASDRWVFVSPFP